MRSAAIILSAGKGTRMPGDLPKVAHEVAGAPMARWVVDACRDAGCERIVLVVGYKQEIVRSMFEREAREGVVTFAVQGEQLGTGHATAAAEDALRGYDGPVIVLAGDGPLVRAQTLALLVDLHARTKAAATLATATIADPTGYGRIIRDGAGRFARIVEEKNASALERAIREVYPSICCFDARTLFATLRDVRRDELTGEYYLTDAPRLVVERGGRVELLANVPPEEALSVNTPAQRDEVDAMLRERLGASPARGAKGVAR